MKILVIDAQGGGLGKQIITELKKNFPDQHITAVGTNIAATQAMLKAGADEAATGENPVIVCSASADIILGPIGIAIANSMLGEVTAAMAEAVGSSRARRILIPVDHCDNFIVGTAGMTMSAKISEVIKEVERIIVRST